LGNKRNIHWLKFRSYVTAAAVAVSASSAFPQTSLTETATKVPVETGAAGSRSSSQGPTTASANAQDERRLTREERIKRHHERIESIIRHNKEKYQYQRTGLTSETLPGQRETSGTEYKSTYTIPEDERGLSREERIQRHRERIEAIIAENREKQQQYESVAAGQSSASLFVRRETSVGTHDEQSTSTKLPATFKINR
jgi:3-methyladenine DNA glycosylase Tag